MYFIWKCTDEDKYESIQKYVSDYSVNNTAQNIKVGPIGAIYDYDRHPHG